MGDSLKALEEMAKAHGTTSTTLRSGINEIYHDVNSKYDEMNEAKNEKDFDKRKKELAGLYDKLDKGMTAYSFSLDQWSTATKKAETALDAEIKSAEEAFKAIKQDADDIDRLNDKIKEYNKGREGKEQLPLEKPITLSTDSLASLKSFAAEVMFTVGVVAEKKQSLGDWEKRQSKAKKERLAAKFQQGRKK